MSLYDFRLIKRSNKRDVIMVVNDILEQFTFPFLITGEIIYTSASIGISMGILEKTQKDYMQKVEVLIRTSEILLCITQKNKTRHSRGFNTDDQNDKKGKALHY